VSAAESGRWVRKLLVGSVMFSRRRPALVAVLAALLALGSIAFIVRNFKIDTDTNRLLFQNGSFTRLNNRLAHDFPSLSRRVIIVVRSSDASTTRRAIRAIVSTLSRHPRSYPFVYAPTAEPLFARDGLLYLSTPRLRVILKRLTKAEPLLGTLMSNPSVGGYARFLSEVIRHTKQLPQGERVLVGSIMDANTALLASHASGTATKTTFNPQRELFGQAGSLSQAERTTGAIIVSLPAIDKQANHAKHAIAKLKQLLNHIPTLARTGVRWSLTGSVVLGLDQLRAVTTGTDLATILSIVLSIGLLIIGLRSVRLLLPVLITLLTGLVLTTAFALVALGPLNLISVAFGVLFIGLGVDFSIQFCIRLQEELAKQSDANMAFNATAYRIGFALVLASLAAASCFYAVIPTGYSGIRDLGIIAGTGTLIALLLNLTLLPALLTLFHAGRITVRRPPIPFAKLPVQKLGRSVLVLSIVLIAFSLFLIPRLSFDFDLAHLEAQDSQAYRTLHSLERQLSFSPYTLEAIAPTLAQADRLARTVRRLPSVGRVLTLSSYLPRNQEKKIALISNVSLLYPPPAAHLNTREPPANIVRDCQLLAHLGQEARQLRHEAPASLRATYARFAAAMEGAFGTSCNPVAVATLRTRLVGPMVALGEAVDRLLNPIPVTLQSLPVTLRENYLSSSGQARVEIFSRLNLHRAKNLKTFVDQVSQVIPNIGGTPVLFVRGGHIVTTAFREASLLAFLFIIVIVCIVLRSARDVVLTIVPLVLSVALTLSTLALLHIRFNIANIIVIPLSIGLSVAFGIYMILRWKNSHYDIHQVLRSSAPEGIMISGMTTLLVFGTLVLTPSPGLFSLGITLLIALFWTLVSSLVILPSILFVVQSHTHTHTQT